MFYSFWFLTIYVTIRLARIIMYCAPGLFQGKNSNPNSPLNVTRLVSCSITLNHFY